MRFRLIVVFIIYALSQLDFSDGRGIENAAVKEGRQEREPRNIIDDIFSTVTGLFGPRFTTTLAPPKIMFDDIIITPPPFPTLDNPHWRPGTTNNGGIVNQVFATFSGIASGVFGVLGVEEPFKVIHGPTPASFPLPQDIRSQIDSFKTGLNSVNRGPPTNTPQQIISNYLKTHEPESQQQQQDGLGNLLSGILG